MAKIPVFNGGAGEPSLWTDEGYPIGHSSEYVAIPANGTDENTFAVKVHGESMAPFLLPGDIVVVVPSARLANGEVCFATWQNDGGEKLVKRFYRYGDVVVLRSDNPNKKRFPDLEIGVEEFNRIRMFRINQVIRKI